MQLAEYLDTPAIILATAFEHKTLSPRKNPDVEQALRVVAGVVQDSFVDKVSAQLIEELTEAVGQYELRNGEHSSNFADEHERDDYESGMDDVIEAVFEVYDAQLSADWLGKNTIDTTPWEENGIPNLAKSAAKEMFKQLTFERTPAQILAGAAILKPDVEAALAAHLATEAKPMAVTELNELIGKMKTHLGTAFDQLAVMEDVETILEDDDDILTSSAAGRLGLDEDETGALQIEALALPDGAAQIVELIEGYSLHAPPKAKPRAAPSAPSAPAEPVTGGVSGTVLDALKTCGVQDTAMAERLGVSRSTYLNYIKGKTAFNPNEDQYALVRTELVERANVLTKALAELDGTAVQVVA